MKFDIKKMIVAAEDTSTADAIAALRNLLAGGGETMVNQDGTVLNPGDPMSASSLANGDGFKPVDHAVVAVEWSKTKPPLQTLEMKARAKFTSLIPFKDMFDCKALSTLFDALLCCMTELSQLRDGLLLSDF